MSIVTEMYLHEDLSGDIQYLSFSLDFNLVLILKLFLSRPFSVGLPVWVGPVPRSLFWLGVRGKPQELSTRTHFRAGGQGSKSSCRVGIIQITNSAAVCYCRFHTQLISMKRNSVSEEARLLLFPN